MMSSKPTREFRIKNVHIHFKVTPMERLAIDYWLEKNPRKSISDFYRRIFDFDEESRAIADGLLEIATKE